MHKQRFPQRLTPKEDQQLRRMARQLIDAVMKASGHTDAAHAKGGDEDGADGTEQAV